MSKIDPSVRGNLSLVLSLLALVVALSGTAYAALGAGSVGTKQLAKGAVTKGKIENSAVTAPKIRNGAVASEAIRDRTVRLHDLGGGVVNQTRTTSSVINLAAGECRSVSLNTIFPAPNGLLGSMVVGTITNSSGGAVVSNPGFVLPTLVTETSQGGAVLHLGVCAGGSAQTIPVGSIVTYSVIAP